MDVISPPVVWIEGKCFRKNIVNPIFQPNALINRDESIFKKSYEDDDIRAYEDDEEIAAEENLQIVELENGNFKTVLSIPSTFFGQIIGQKGAVKKRIEQETGTKIIIRNDPEEIIIQSTRKSSIQSAKIRIDSIVDSARQKTPFTHFISIPLNDSSSKNSFLDFRDAVLRQCDGDRGVDERIFQIPEKLHLTLGTLVSLNQRERDVAAKTLQFCKESILDEIFEEKKRPIRVKISGIEYMNDDPAEVDVLYAKVECVDDSEKLQTLADRIVREFASTGLMTKQYERVKLHLTIMNAAFRKSKTESQTSGKQNRETFDARQILKIFGEHNFCQTEIKSIHVSQRHSVGKDGYYAVSSKIDT